MTIYNATPELRALLNELPAVLEPWNTSAAPAFVRTYRFEVGQPTDNAWPAFTGWTPLTTQAKAAIRLAMDRYEDVLNVKFIEAAANDPDPNVSFGVANTGASSGLGFYNYQYFTNPQGQVTSRTLDALALFSVSASTDMTTILHEIGHTMTLRHPGNYDSSGSPPPPPYLPAAEENNKFTVMSYTANPDSGTFPAYLMLYDVAALQQRFGANLATRSGDSVYGAPGQYSTPTGSMGLIWDGGGRDLLRWDGATGAALDLRPGGFSSLGAVDNVVIAFGATIEDGQGGTGADTLLGNDTGNSLSGGDGADTLDGAAAADILFGGNGDDTVIGGAGADSLNGGDGNDAADYSALSNALNIQLHTSLADAGAQGGFDQFASIENAVGGSAADQEWGNQFANVLTGNDGADWLHGFGANDTLYGGNGGDQVLGGDGADTLYGGDGNDFFWFDNQDALFGGAGIDYAYNTDTNAVTVNLGTASIEGVWANNGADLLDAATATVSVQLIGYGSADTLRGGSAGDYIWFDELDSITGGSGIDAAYATTANGVTVSYAAQGIEQVWATNGNDLLDASAMTIDGVYLIAYAGTDTVLGGSGNDFMWVDWNAGDSVQGGAGRDELYQIGTGAMTLDLGARGIEAVLGSNQGDLLDGSSQTQWLLLIGLDGNDTLVGGTGNDNLFGGNGADGIMGGAGNDIFLGGAGADTFVHTFVVGGSGTDQFFDFASGDKILVSGNNVLLGLGTTTAVLTDGSTLVTTNGYNWLAGDFV